MAQSFHFVNPPVPVTVTTTAQWVNYNINSYVSNLPSDVTGVILRIKMALNTAIGWRMGGSTDTSYSTASGSGAFIYPLVGVNSLGVFQLYAAANDDTIQIIGYTTTGVTLYTNRISRGPTKTGWQAMTALPQGAIGGIYHVLATMSARGWRMSGSTDNRPCSGGGAVGVIMGCSALGVVDCYQQIAMSSDIKEAGYITDGAVLNINATVMNPSTFGTFSPLPQIPQAVVTFFEFTGGGALRPGGSQDPTFWEGSRAVVPSPGGVVEGNTTSGNPFYLLGYATGTINTNYDYATNISTTTLLATSRLGAFNRQYAIGTKNVTIGTRLATFGRAAQTKTQSAITTSRAWQAARETATKTKNVLSAAYDYLAGSVGYAFTALLTTANKVTSAREWNAPRTSFGRTNNAITASRKVDAARTTAVATKNTATANRAWAVVRTAAAATKSIITAIWEHVVVPSGYVFTARIITKNHASGERQLTAKREAAIKTKNTLFANRAWTLAKQASTKTKSVVTASRAWGVLRQALVACKSVITVSVGRNKRRKCIPGESASCKMEGLSYTELTGTSRAMTGE